MKSKAALVLADAIDAAAASAPKAEIAAPEQPPADLHGTALDLWIIDQELRETRIEMHGIRYRMRTENGSAHGLAALGSRLDSLMDRRRELRPAEPTDPDEEERRWRTQADSAVKKVKAGVEQARKDMAALLGRPFPGDANVVARGLPASAS